ncbi:MAG: hypothetical protein LV481_14560 [Methylacidiphilales bacterium]|nr:hypothetical protein [Candidatus Methylacidiphilales bacterium]
MNEHDGVLDFLTDGLIGRERDAVARAFYGYATGDPNSEPVGISVLLTACMRKLAQLPEKLQSGTAAFQKVVAEARELEKGLIEKVNRSNAVVVAAFKDETARASLTLRETALEAKATVVQAERIHGEMKPVIARMQEIGKDLLLLRDDLRRFDTSVQRSEKAVEDVKDIHKTTLDIVKHLTKEIRANWTTIGLGFGMALEYAVAESLQPAPFYAHFVLFVVLAGIVQGLLRWDWRLMRKQAKKILPPAKTKPAG